MKKTIAAILAGAMTLYSLSIPALAAGSSSTYGLVLPGGILVHSKEVFSGSYLDENNKNLALVITPNAQTSLLTTSVYNSATAWNNISNNVHVQVYFDSLPSSYSNSNTAYPIMVYGQVMNGGVLGQTVPYNVHGNKGEEVANDDWSFVFIYINNSVNAFSSATNPTTAAKMNFTHEVGHALKLAHPTKKSSIAGHTYDGYPYAVMNQGYPKSAGGPSQVSSIPTWHDTECLTYKWGE